jgi:hypothetical protein
MSINPAHPSDLALEEQLTHDALHHIYTIRCGICQKAKSRKKFWFRSHNGTVCHLRREFNFCNACATWVCEDCFLVDDGMGAIGICTSCAKKKGINGYTNEQLKTVMPERQRKYREMREAEKNNRRK